jgi:hypothetical protein
LHFDSLACFAQKQSCHKSNSKRMVLRKDKGAANPDWLADSFTIRISLVISTTFIWNKRPSKIRGALCQCDWAQRFWCQMTRFAQPCIHTDALSVLLSALYLYPLPRILIQRRTCTSGAGSSLFCALTVE